MATEKASPKYQLNKVDLLKIGRGALIAGTGAAAYYALGELKFVDAGTLAPIYTAILSIVTNAVVKFLEGK